jgi:hypothetical protein
MAMEDNDYPITVDDAEVERMTNFGAQHKEISQLLDYPPFSLYRDRKDKVVAAMTEASADAATERNKTNLTRDNILGPVMELFKDDLDEARLYMKRYGSDVRAAQKAAMKLDDLNDTYSGLMAWPE